MEAVRAAAPVIVGPHMENFGQLCEAFVNAGGIFQVKDAAELQKKVSELLQSPQGRLSLSETGRKVFLENLGAARRAAGIIVDSLKTRST